MADSGEEGALSEEEREFRRSVAAIGGRERIYLVSGPCANGEVEGGGAGVLQELVGAMFPGDPPGRSGCASRAAETPKDPRACATGAGGDRRGGARGPRRAIDSAAIVFIFRQTFLSDRSNRPCLEEILRDVRARTRGAAVARPALIGLVRAGLEGDETRRCAELLERLLRAVFRAHPPDTVWAGCFVPTAEAHMLNIKRNACKVINSSRAAGNTSDSMNPLLKPFRCLLWQQRRGARGQADTSTRKRGDSGSTEESIPLETNPLSGGPSVNGELVGGDN